MNSNFKRKLLAGLFVPALGLSVGTALAQTTTPNVSTDKGAVNTQSTTMGQNTSPATSMWNTQHFDRLDKNRDGKISREEAQADNNMRDHWSKLDTSNAGSVSRADYDKYSRTLNPNSANPMQNNVPGKGPQK